MLTVKNDYNKMESYAKIMPMIFGIISFSILVVILIIIITVVLLTTDDICKNKYSNECLYSKMIMQKKDYPEGKRWTNDNCYSSKYLGGGCGCAGFAYLLSDVCFGSIKTNRITDCSTFKVGDVVRVNGNTHSVIILKIDYKTNIITIAEGNYGGTIHWGRTFKISSLQGNCDYIHRRNPN